MRILIVEDERLIANSLKKGLEQEKFAVDVCYDGLEGYDLASTEEYDLLILDLMLPGMDGLEICRQIRQKKITTPVLILTAKSQVSDKVAGLNTGADDYLTKPFSFDELLARIRALTRRTAAKAVNVLEVDGLTLDPISFQVLRHGKLIKLSAKEFSLLEFLMRHPHQIVKKDRIVDHVWDYNSDILPNTVEVYIKNLRQKIDVPFKSLPPLINTVRGFGYKLGK